MTTLMNLGKGLSRPARFILAYILWVGYCDLQQATNKNSDCSCLSVRVDAGTKLEEYLELLYGKKLSLPLVRNVFRATVIPPTYCDAVQWEHFFDSFRQDCEHIPPSNNDRLLFSFEFRSTFLKAIPLEKLFYDVIDQLLYWPRGLGKLFFDQFSQPTPKSIRQLVERLDIPQTIQLTKRYKPVCCPLCGYKPLTEVLIGMPSSEIIPEMKAGKYILYGCCLDAESLPPDWKCPHCGLPIHKGTNVSDYFSDM